MTVWLNLRLIQDGSWMSVVAGCRSLVGRHQMDHNGGAGDFIGRSRSWSSSPSPSPSSSPSSSSSLSPSTSSSLLLTSSTGNAVLSGAGCRLLRAPVSVQLKRISPVPVGCCWAVTLLPLVTSAGRPSACFPTDGDDDDDDDDGFCPQGGRSISDNCSIGMISASLILD